MKPGDIMTHTEMCQVEGQMLQRGMTFRPPPLHGIILMSQRPNAPYADVLDDDGNLVYEGHDETRGTAAEPKRVDQPRYTARGRPTENGKFADWTDEFKAGKQPPARFRVYEKIRDGMWSYRGMFLLRDYRYESSGARRVFRFVLKAMDDPDGDQMTGPSESLHLAQTRQIPTWVKQFVFKRDGGKCVICGSADQIHFDHDLPFSKGGSSAMPENVRVLCARHNLSKGARIE
ncbi:MAG: HNH endonuclease [Dehalococcoidia bacterium]